MRVLSDRDPHHLESQSMKNLGAFANRVIGSATLVAARRLFAITIDGAMIGLSAD